MRDRIKSDGNGGVNVNLQKTELWKVWVSAAAIVAVGGVGVRELTLDVLALVKGAEATEVRIQRLEKDSEEIQGLVFSTREEIASLRTVQVQLVRTLEAVNRTLETIRRDTFNKDG